MGDREHPETPESVVDGIEDAHDERFAGKGDVSRAFERDPDGDSGDSGSIGMTNAILLVGAVLCAFLAVWRFNDGQWASGLGYAVLLVFLFTAYRLKHLDAL